MVELSCEGDVRRASAFTKSYAGDTFNTAVAAARLGSKTAYVTRVGDDPFALDLLQTLKQENIDTRYVKTMADAQTGLYFISQLENGRRDFLYYRKNSAASMLCPEDIDEDAIRNAKIVYASGITLALSESAYKAVFKAFSLARRHGVMTAFDPNFRRRLWRTADQAFDALNQLIPYIDIILPSIPEDTEAVIGLQRPDQVIDFFSFKDVKVVVVKAGNRGCFLHYKRKTEHIPAMRVQPMDLTGAGDAFNGGFLHGLADQQSLVDCARLGVTVAGLRVQHLGVLKSLPDKDAVYARAFSL